MPADVSAPALPDSRPLYRLVRRARRLLRSSWVATGLCLSLGLLLGTLVALTLIDLTVPLPPTTWTVAGRVLPVDSFLRLAALCLVVVPAAWAFVAGVVRPLFRRLAAVHVARRIESHIPGIHNRLVSCIDLDTRGLRGTGIPARAGSAGQECPAHVSPVFYRRLLTEALERIRGFRPSMVLDSLSLRKATLFAAAASLSFLLMWCLFSDRVPRAMARIFLPFADLPPVSRVVYTVEPGDADVLREEPIAFAVRVTSDADPEELRLELYNDIGQPTHRYDLVHDKQDPKLWKYTVDGSSLGAGYEDGFRYRVYGGGTWSKQHSIRLVERPVLVSVGTAVYYPAYMGIPEPHPTPPQAVEVTGPEGGEVEVRVEAQGQVATGEVQMLRPSVRPIPRKDQSERAWFADRLPFGTTAEGTWNWERRDGRATHTEPVAIGTHGHWFQGDPVGHAVNNGDILFAYVYLSGQHAPESIMLQWFDGESWDHGAYWGADRIKEGKANTVGRRHVADLPAAGQWVRLEVPAGKVGLEGRTLRGMAFKLHGGQCFWGRAGTVQIEEPGVEVVKTYPMTRSEDGSWSGRFPLAGSGLFRAELRNQQGHPNKSMKELKYVALPDKPPQVLLERQSTEMVLSKAAAVPLAVKAFDDYGLAEINVLVRGSETAPYRSRTLERLATPKRDASLVASLTEAADLKQGATLRYLIEAKDRKGQTARTREYLVRVAADVNAADQQLTQFAKTQDTFRDRLVQLIAEQKKVQGPIEKLNREYAALTEKVQSQIDKQSQETGKPPKDRVPELKLDPETAKRLAELQKELARLGKQEEQNTNLAQQISNDLAKAAEKAGNLEMLPKPVADQMAATQQEFQNMVADALRDLGRRMNQGADPKQTPAPDLADLRQRGDRIQKEMEGIKNRLESLANARKGLREDLRAALQQLQRELLNETGKMTARELEQLRDFLAQMRERMKTLQDRQEELMKDALEGKDVQGLKRKQEDLDRQIEKMLARTRHLLDSKKKRNGDRPEFPDSPYTPEGKEEKVPPREEDTDEPLPGKKDRSGKNKPGDKNDKKASGKEDDEKEPLYMPALGGPKPKIDPRYAKKRRPVKPRPKDGKNDPAGEQREQMEDRQNDRLRDLQAARESLGSDQQTLEQMLRQLQQSMQSKGESGKGQPNESEGEADQLARQLQEMMQSPAMRAARQMASRMRQGPPGQPRQGQPQQGQPAQASQGNLQGGQRGGMPEADLSKLDPQTRAIILKLPPSRLRDELIQGMNEQGPEAYRAFIQDYFKRLTDTKPAGK